MDPVSAIITGAINLGLSRWSAFEAEKKAAEAQRPYLIQPNTVKWIADRGKKLALARILVNRSLNTGLNQGVVLRFSTPIDLKYIDSIDSIIIYEWKLPSEINDFYIAEGGLRTVYANELLALLLEELTPPIRGKKAFLDDYYIGAVIYAGEKIDLDNIVLQVANGIYNTFINTNVLSKDILVPPKEITHVSWGIGYDLEPKADLIFKAEDALHPLMASRLFYPPNTALEDLTQLIRVYSSQQLIDPRYGVTPGPLDMQQFLTGGDLLAPQTRYQTVYSQEEYAQLQAAMERVGVTTAGLPGVLSLKSVFMFGLSMGLLFLFSMPKKG